MRVCVCVNMYFDVFCIRYIMYVDVEVACAINLEKASPFPEFIARAGRPGSGLLSGTEPQRHSKSELANWLLNFTLWETMINYDVLNVLIDFLKVPILERGPFWEHTGAESSISPSWIPSCPHFSGQTNSSRKSRQPQWEGHLWEQS